MPELSNALRLQFRYTNDNEILLYQDCFKHVEYMLCGLEELILDRVITITIGKTIIKLPYAYEIMQTEETVIDMIPLTKILPIPLLTIDGKFAINTIDKFTYEVSEEKVHWIVPSIPRKHFAILENGLIINPFPPKYKKELVKRIRKKK